MSQTSDKIPGNALLGFNDYFADSERDVVGAASSRRAVPKRLLSAKISKASRTTYRKGSGQMSGLPRSAVTAQHGKVMRSARVVAAKAAKAVSVARASLQKHLQAAAGRKKVVIGLDEAIGNVEIGGVDDPTTMGYVEIGAAAAGTLTPRAKLAVKRHNEALARADKDAKALARQTLKTKAAVVALAKQLSSQRAVSAKLQGKKRGAARTRLRGDASLELDLLGQAAQAIFQEYYDSVGAAPDPANPGYLDDGTPDPAYAAASPRSAPETAAESDSFESPLDSGVELPPPPPMDTFISDMEAVGGILYDGSKGTPDGYVGSYGLMTRTTDIDSGVPDTLGIDPVFHYGFVFGRYDADGVEKGIRWGSNLPSGVWNHVKGRWILGAFREDAFVHKSGGLAQVDAATALTSIRVSNPKGVSYGPLIGNPAMPNFKGMRVDGSGRMFWLPQEAPDWLTYPLKQAAALTAQKEKAAAEAAAKAEALQRAKDAADAAAAQAQQEAANALAESQAASAARVADIQTASEAKAAEAKSQAEAQQQLVETERSKTARRDVETSQQKQVGDLLLQQAQADAEQERRVTDLLIQQAQVEVARNGGEPEGEAQASGDGEADEGAEYEDTEYEDA